MFIALLVHNRKKEETVKMYVTSAKRQDLSIHKVDFQYIFIFLNMF